MVCPASLLFDIAGKNPAQIFSEFMHRIPEILDVARAASGSMKSRARKTAPTLVCADFLVELRGFEP